MPILVGGAALSRNFVDRNIAPAYGGGTVAYAQDAMSGLELAKQIVDPAAHEKLKGELAERRTKLAQRGEGRGPRPVPAVAAVRSKEVAILEQVPPRAGLRAARADEHAAGPHLAVHQPGDALRAPPGPAQRASRALGTPAEAELARTEEGRKALALKEQVESSRARCATGA